jgi:hypothetical protein
MALRRITIHVDEQDLAIIKEAAARRGVPQTEIIRRGVHLAAMRERRWAEPLGMPTLDRGDPTPGETVNAAGALSRLRAAAADGAFDLELLEDKRNYRR